VFAFRVSCFGGMGFWSCFCWKKLGLLLFFGCELLGLPVNSNYNQKASIQGLGSLRDLGCTWLDHSLLDSSKKKMKKKLEQIVEFLVA
jgi:hypothetical protein